MSQQTLLDFNRRNINLTESKIKEILPSHYLSDYPNLVKFLEYYYNFLDSDTNHGFDRIIQDLYKIRDLKSTEVSFLNQIFYEIGQKSVSADFFVNPQLVANLLGNFYKIKGSLYSAEGFFRAFYGEQPQVIYPKNSLFIVGQSEIGPESLKILQDGALYQVLSVLIRSGVPISKWRDLYKSFVHPSGFFLGGEVAIESFTDLNLGLMPESIADSSSGIFGIEGTTSTIPVSSLLSITLIVPDEGDADSSAERLLTTAIQDYQSLTINQINNLYNNIQELLDPNSPTFDDDSAVGDKAIKFSNAIETMDQDAFAGLYGADSPGI